MGEAYAAGDWVVCLKCGSKFLLRVMEAKKQYSCLMCGEPGMRMYNPSQPDTIDGPVWPEER